MDYPYILILRAVLAAGGAASLNYPVPQNESLEVEQIRIVSTGAFSITDIRDSAGYHYTNASPATPILSTLIQSGASPNIGFQELSMNLKIDGGKILYIDIVDTSGAPNTVNVSLSGIRHSE